MLLDFHYIIIYCHKISAYQFKLNQPSKPCSKLGINLCGPMRWISRESTPLRCVFLSLVWWLISWRCRSEWAHLFLLMGHRETSFWESDSNHYLTVTCVWQWPVSDCDQYLTVSCVWQRPVSHWHQYLIVTIVWLWPVSDCSHYLTVTTIWLRPASDCDQDLTVIRIWMGPVSDCD